MPHRKPLCFILMPFGVKKDPINGMDIDFDVIYESGIRLGIEKAGMLPIRADEELIGGIIHKPMFERLMLCDYAVADLTTANANVFYELGVRHAVRPATTLTIFANHQHIPFDVNIIRSLPYDLGEYNRFGPDESSVLVNKIQKKLEELKNFQHKGVIQDSPVFQLLKDYRPPDISRLKTDVFRDQAEYSISLKRALAKARVVNQSAAVHEIESSLQDNFETVELGVLVDLILSYRAVKDWQAMVDIYQKLPEAAKRAVLIREQLGFALNRLKRSQEALTVLEEIIDEHGPSSETYGLIGRIYKDQWVEAKQKNEELLASGYLDKAISSYMNGFETDIRDAYPGINAITLMEIKGDNSSLESLVELLPVVAYAVKLRLTSAQPDYWDYATLLELAVLAHDKNKAKQHLGKALASVREPWEPLSTANNLKLIYESRNTRSIYEPWLKVTIDNLVNAGK